MERGNRKKGLTDQLRPFTDIMVMNEPPAVQFEPRIRDAVLDGRKVDIYHLDDAKKEGATQRIYIHIK